MDKENVLYTYDGILFSFKWEGNPAMRGNMYEPGGNYAKWNITDTDVINTECCHLHEIHRIVSS